MVNSIFYFINLVILFIVPCVTHFYYIKSIHLYFPHNPAESFKSWFYSVLKLFTGFAIAAFIAWKLIVTNAITSASITAIRNIHQLISTRYA